MDTAAVLELARAPVRDRVDVQPRRPVASAGRLRLTDLARRTRYTPDTSSGSVHIPLDRHDHTLSETRVSDEVRVVRSGSVHIPLDRPDHTLSPVGSGRVVP